MARMLNTNGQPAKRGDTVQGQLAEPGVYVGTSAYGTPWVCYGGPDEFDLMCGSFDRLVSPDRLHIPRSERRKRQLKKEQHPTSSIELKWICERMAAVA